MADTARGASGSGRCATQPLQSARRTSGTATGERKVNLINSYITPAGVMELVDVVDSKSTAGDSVPVRVRPPAPIKVIVNEIHYDLYSL